ncbi:MAG: metallophosphoesterase family protein [candidate division KSB1 bacterium]|nr:metallophosphoesterase family protein [candidate division KSB1 bacterium]
MATNQKIRRIGIISDTHGKLDPDVHRIFANVDTIIHTGDIGKDEILTELECIAPVNAVFGNTDQGPLRDRLKAVLMLSLGTYKISVTHYPEHLRRILIDTEQYNIQCAGHTHEPLIKQEHNRLYINPGSASQPRGGYEPSVALLNIDGIEPEAEIVFLGTDMENP